MKLGCNTKKMNIHCYFLHLKETNLTQIKQKNGPKMHNVTWGRGLPTIQKHNYQVSTTTLLINTCINIHRKNIFKRVVS